MANIEIKRGQQTQVSLKYKPDGISATRNFYTADAQYTASLVLRKKAGGSVSGEKIDTLISLTPNTDNPSANPPVIQSTHGRIRFPQLGADNRTDGTQDNANIILRWETADSITLPNEQITIIGDLKITDTDASPDEVIHSLRLTFDIVPEII
tara:strand:- start:1397 stop:1855 length:459 start_codon:yes stop_codon:yes gene_type:complete